MEPYPCTFKIPITVQKGGVQNYMSDNAFKQSIEIFDPNAKISLDLAKSDNAVQLIN